MAIKYEQPKFNVRSSKKIETATEEGRWHSIERHCLNYVKAYLWSEARAAGWRTNTSTSGLCDLTSMSLFEVEACLEWLEIHDKISRNEDAGRIPSIHINDIFFDVYKTLPGDWRLDVWTPEEAFK